MYIIPPASATVASFGSSSISTNCISSPNTLYSISCIVAIGLSYCDFRFDGSRLTTKDTKDIVSLVSFVVIVWPLRRHG